MNVLVLGGAGYIGSVLTPKLKAAGHDWTVVDKRLPHSPDRMSADLRPHDVVVDLAGIVGDAACAADPAEAIWENYSQVLAMLARPFKKLIYVSSCSVYGASDDEILSESSKINPVSLYGWTKVAAEQLIRESGHDATILRLGTVHGRSPQQRWDLVVNLLTRRAVTEGKITIFNENQWRPFVHVNDVANAIVASLELVPGRTFNVATQNLCLHDVAEMVQAMLPKPVEVELVENEDRRNYRVDAAPFHDATGWQATRSIGDTVLELADALV